MQAGLIGEQLSGIGGQFTAAVTQAQIAAGPVVVKVGQARLCRVLVTSAATAGAAVNIFDNATTGSGTIIGVIPIGAIGETIFDLPAQFGITIGQQAGLTTGNFTISFD